MVWEKRDLETCQTLSAPRSARGVVLTALAFYTLFTIIALATHGWDPLWFAWQGDRYAKLESMGTTGYDGQFVLYIARDGWQALPHLDNPAYRLQRILTPLVARGLSLGLPALTPWTIVTLNAVAIIATTAILARWLSAQTVSPWYALTYTLFVGTLMAYSRDLTEPLALFLAASGAVGWLKKDYRVAWAAWCLAALSKEIMLLFPIGAAVVALLRGETKLAAGAGLTAVPLLGWETYLYARLGEVPFLAGPSLEHVPLMGITGLWTTEPGHLSAIVLIAFAGLYSCRCHCGACVSAARRSWVSGYVSMPSSCFSFRPMYTLTSCTQDGTPAAWCCL